MNAESYGFTFVLSVNDENRKVIQESTLSVLVNNITKQRTEMEDLVTSFGGYIVNIQVISTQ